MTEYPCGGCGARVEFAPGTTVLRCPYCGYEQQVAQAEREVTEHDFAALATLPRKPVATLGKLVLVCRKCGAQTQTDALADLCQFCAAPLVADADAIEQIAPEAVLPFEIDRSGVRAALRTWAASRWFAPSSLKKVTEAETVRSTYLPHWTFDSNTVTDYTGQRGEHYWVTETYTETVNGESRTATRQVQKTRWHPAQGTVERSFDDILVPATQKVATEDLTKLDPWPLHEAVPYQPDYLAGHQALRYDVEPESGFSAARVRMEPIIRDDCRHDIGGDEQRVHSMDTRYLDVMYKLMLLPVWIVAYLHAGRSWQVMVNARTGEVIGKRPYSALKITLAVLAAVLVIVAAIVIYVSTRK